jgi:hypothetical protein
MLAISGLQFYVLRGMPYAEMNLRKASSSSEMLLSLLSLANVASASESGRRYLYILTEIEDSGTEK